MPTRSTILTALFALAATASLQATVLTYGISPAPAEGTTIPADYGDRVTGTTMSGAGGATYSYADFGEGFSQRILADHGDANFFPGTGFGDLSNVAFAADGTFSLTLTADVGFNVILQSFDLAGFFNSQVVGNISIFGDNVLLASASNVTVSGTGRTNSSTFLSQSSFRAATIRLTFDSRNLGAGQGDVGIDNIVFAQAVPEPSVTALLAGAAVAGVLLRRRQTRRS